MLDGPASSDPTWLREIRQQAWSSFHRLGFPTARRGNENWKYTNVRPLAAAGFEAPACLPNPDALGSQLLQQSVPWVDGWVNLVFVDGKFAASHSSGLQESKGAHVANLAGAIASGEPMAERHLATHAQFAEDGFTALNTAFVQDGAFVHIPDGSRAPAPLHLIFVTTDNWQGKATFPRNLVVVGQNASLKIAESYLSVSGFRYFTDAVTEFEVGDGADVEHYRLLLESPEAFHVGTSRVHQGQDSSFKSGAFAMGAALARNDFQVTLDAPGASCSLNGLYLTTGNQHIDNLINIDHAKPHTTSRLFYKGILDGKSRAIFGGTVLVRKDAQKSDARQTDKNLLLSAEAEVDSKPSLLIYADDVQCGHGATAGHIDQETLFYMQSRGLDRETASRILIHAFASEMIETVALEPLRDYLDNLFRAAMPTGTLSLGGGS